jgi:hypothetical protein
MKWGPHIRREIIPTLISHNSPTTLDSTPLCLGVVHMLCTVSAGITLYIWKMLDLQHQYNNCTTISHIRVGPSIWGPPSCEGLLYSCCIGVVNLTFSNDWTLLQSLISHIRLHSIVPWCSAHVVHCECRNHSIYIYMENVRFTTPIQQLYNNLSHKGGSHILGPTLMWGIVVQLLYWCCKSNIFQWLNTTSKYNFSPPCICGKVVPHLNLFLKNKKTQKVMGDYLAT